ncbi:MAG: hypothetical protein JNJ57_17160 [Saprospiraceae bacterium]|nr:hypothetical protein [Saprospiraceae bacterium]
MKHLLYAFFLIHCHLAAQTFPTLNIRFKYVPDGYTAAQIAADFSHARALTHPDSAKLRVSLLQRVHHFDSTSANGLLAKTMLDSLWNEKRTALLDQLTGCWEWYWDGSSWDTDDEPSKCHCTRQLTITTDSLYFFQNDTLQRTLPYRIHTELSRQGGNRLVIAVQDEAGLWAIERLSESHGRKSDAGDLFINHHVFCACGCLESIYRFKGK